MEPIPLPADVSDPTRTEDQWLDEMKSWPLAAVEAVDHRPEATMAARTAAILRRQAASDERTQSGRPISGDAFDRIVNRTLGRPAESPKIVVNAGPTLQIAANDLFHQIDTFLTGNAAGRSIPFELQERLPSLPDNRDQDREGPADQPSDP